MKIKEIQRERERERERARLGFCLRVRRLFFIENTEDVSNLNLETSKTPIDQGKKDFAHFCFIFRENHEKLKKFLIF